MPAGVLAGAGVLAAVLAAVLLRDMAGRAGLRVFARGLPQMLPVVFPRPVRTRLGHGS
ncbi:hypothetical protein GCM10010406_42020 [Streptomyces thermolineatus]|uniref:Uncharacterized protein n=1 Tax=Streptomyces thermolineatus TaxID=44033 RepID=A0ABP5ZPH1_9ACTN